MIIRYLLFLFIIISASDCFAYIKEPVAVKGVMDLRETANDKFIIKLDGEWEFYWSKLLKPDDFSGDIKLKPDFYGEVPSYWTDYPADSVKTTSMGFATYRLILLLPAGYRNSLGFNMPVFDSSYEIYVDGKSMGKNGTTGKTKDETKPDYEKVLFRFNPASDSVQIIINVSNFHHRRGGFWQPIRIGTFSEVQKGYASAWARDWASISFLMGFSLFFLFFYLIYTRDSLMGFFSLATIGLALRPLFTSNFLINTIMPISWEWIVTVGIPWFVPDTGWLVLVCSSALSIKIFQDFNLDNNRYFRHFINTYTDSSRKYFQLYDLCYLPFTAPDYRILSDRKLQGSDQKESCRLYIFHSICNVVICSDPRCMDITRQTGCNFGIYTHLYTCYFRIYPGYAPVL